MNENCKNRKTISRRSLTAFLWSAILLLIPLVLTSMLSMLRLLTEKSGGSDGWDVCCFLLTALVWAGAAVCTKSRFLGTPLPKTGLILSAVLTVSVLLYALTFAMEQEAVGFRAGLWALGKLLGAPAAVSADGVQVLFGGIMDGAAAMLTCAVYLAISFAAAIPWGKSKN